MSLSRLSIYRPVFAWMLMAALIVFGGIAFMRMGVSQLPDVDFPMITVNATFLGAARLRPILMTSMATVVGAIPPALAIGPGAESRIPMAVCVIGGVIVSTVLTIFVVPCAYSLFSHLERKKKKEDIGHVSLA